MRARDRLVVVWRVEERCNLACAFCGYSRELARERVGADPEQVRALGAALAAYGRAQGRAVLVSWLGGEPFLWRPLLDVSRHFRRDLGLQVSATTNGLALCSTRVRERVLADFAEITVSVDGLGAFHDHVRGRSGLFDDLRASITALSRLKARTGAGPLIRVNTILMGGNVERFEALCRTLAGWGVEAVTFNALGGGERPEFYAGQRLRPEHERWLREELPHIRERMARAGLTVCGGRAYAARIARMIRDVPVPVEECGAGQDFLFVDERGRVAPCAYTLDEYGQAGAWSAQGVERLPGRFATLQREQWARACANCCSTQVFGKFQGGVGRMVNVDTAGEIAWT